MSLTKTYGGFLISRVRQIGNRVFEKKLRETGIDAFNGAQGRILYVLWENESLTIGDIGRLTSLAKTTLTSMLDRMEAAGLIERVRDKENRRRIYVVLTPLARSLKGDYEDVSERINEVFYEGFAEDEVIFFEDTLRRIIKNLEEAERNS